MLNSIRTQSPVVEFSSECKFIQVRSVPNSLQGYPAVTMVNVDILDSFFWVCLIWEEGKGHLT